MHLEARKRADNGWSTLAAWKKSLSCWERRTGTILLPGEVAGVISLTLQEASSASSSAPLDGGAGGLGLPSMEARKMPLLFEKRARHLTGGSSGPYRHRWDTEQGLRSLSRVSTITAQLEGSQRAVRDHMGSPKGWEVAVIVPVISAGLRIDSRGTEEDGSPQGPQRVGITGGRDPSLA